MPVSREVSVNVAFEGEDDQKIIVVRTHPDHSESSGTIITRDDFDDDYTKPPLQTKEELALAEEFAMTPVGEKPVELEIKPEPLPLFGSHGLFKFATGTEKLYMLIGTLAAIVHGAGFPIIFIFYGGMTNDFIAYSQCELYTGVLFDSNVLNNPDVKDCLISEEPGYPYQDCSSQQIQASNFTYLCLEDKGYGNVTGYYPPVPWNYTVVPTPVDVETDIGRYAVIFVIIGFVCMCAAYVQVLFYTWSAAGQAREIRMLFFRSVVNQEIGWFDLNTVGEINAKISEDISKIAEGMGDKFSVLIQKVACFLIGFIVAYIVGWELALIITGIIPLIIVGGFFMGKFVAGMTTKELKAYAQASSISQEVIDGIRVVTAFEGQDRETERYDRALGQAEAQGIKKSFVQGAFMGYIWLVVFIAFAASFYIGANVLNYEAGRLITVFFCILIGSMNLSQAAPNLEAVSIARTAANPVYKIISRPSRIDPADHSGRTLRNVKGNFEFHNVSFYYPSRPDIQILRNCSFKCTAGQISAICGPSGMGKSTIVQLMLRYYDPDEGMITLDGVDIKELDVAWLRSLIAVVEQEPMMLNLTVMENIRFGNEMATDTDVYLAAKKANCYDFIMELPQGFETELTSGGGGLSGGQKQRVAVARALVRNAKILLLDQATSALDTHSEKLVINEINNRNEGTTLIIAHRLSTIRAAHVIFGIEHGTIVEAGDHFTLIRKQGVYFTLVTLQGGDTSLEPKKPKVKKIEAVKEEIDEETGLTRKESKRFRESIRSRTVSTVKAQMPIVLPKNNEPYDPLGNEEKMVQENIGRRILSYNSEEFCLMFWGAVGAAINGAIMPFFSIIFSSILEVLGEPDGAAKNAGVLDWSLGFLGIGIVSFFTQFIVIGWDKSSEQVECLSMHNQDKDN